MRRQELGVRSLEKSGVRGRRRRSEEESGVRGRSEEESLSCLFSSLSFVSLFLRLLESTGATVKSKNGNNNRSACSTEATMV